MKRDLLISFHRDQYRFYFLMLQFNGIDIGYLSQGYRCIQR